MKSNINPLKERITHCKANVQKICLLFAILVLNEGWRVFFQNPANCHSQRQTILYQRGKAPFSTMRIISRLDRLTQIASNRDQQIRSARYFQCRRSILLCDSSGVCDFAVNQANWQPFIIELTSQFATTPGTKLLKGLSVAFLIPFHL